MNRVTDKDLQAVVDRINRELSQPCEPYTKGDDGKYRANIGNYHLDHAYGGVSLIRLVSESGGCSDVLGRYTKRELYNAMHAFLRGIETARSAA